MSKKPVVLMVLDGYGLSDHKEGNAIAMANTPVMDKLMAECPFVKGAASGLAVGLPDGQMGNSEVGHMNIGAGRIIYQDLTRITKAIADGDFFKNKVLISAIENCKKNDSDLHLWGLLSDGGVHSHIEHLYGLLELCKKENFDRVYVHAFLDGRDTPPASGKDYIEQLLAKMKEIGVGKIASLSGRYYAMDRDNNWDRVQKAYDSLTKGEGVKATCPVKAMEESYANDVTDEFVLPTVITNEDGTPVSVVKDNDSVIFFNFRPDRAREMTRAFCDDKFTGFERPFLKTTFVCFKDYDESIPNKLIAFEKEEIKKAEEDNKALFDFMTEKLGGKVKAVKLSQRLKTHPVCVTSEGALSVEMEKVLSAMPDEQAHTAKAAKILEINASHPIFEKLKKLYAEDKKDTVAEYADILYSQALLIEGMPIEDPVEFTNKLCTIMAD